MGVIQKQSITGAIWSYIGVGLGFVITVFLFAHLLTTEEIGLLRVLVSYSTIIAMFAGLGMNTVTVRLFPYFRDEKRKHHGYLGIVLMVSAVGFVVAILIYALFRPMIIENAQEKSALFIPYFWLVVPLTFFTVLFSALDSYFRVLFNAVKGIIFKEVVQRLFIIAVVLLFYFGWIEFAAMVWLYVLAYISPALFLLISLIRNHRFFIRPDLKFITPALKKEMINVAVFGVLAGFSNVLVQSIDVIMVNDFLGLSFTGIYTISFFFGTLILIPMRTMGKIGSVVIAEAWKKNDFKLLADIYRKSSLSLSIIGILLFIGIWGNIENVFYLVGQEYRPGKYVIFFIALANLTDIFMGLSSHIIVNSKYFRWQTYLIVIFAVIVVISNLLLIPPLGIVGAALASFVSKFIFNAMKFVFIYRRFGFQPFIPKHLVLLLIGIVAWYLSTLLPAFSNFVADIVIRSILITVVFMVPVYFFRISDDVNERINATLTMLFSGKKPPRS